MPVLYRGSAVPEVKAFIFHPAVKEIKNDEGQVDITTL